MGENKIDLMLEAERRGILPDDKRALLGEARRRGLVPPAAGTPAPAAPVPVPAAPEEEPSFLRDVIGKSANDIGYGLRSGAMGIADTVQKLGGLVGSLPAAGDPLTSLAGKGIGYAAGKAKQALGKLPVNEPESGWGKAGAGALSGLVQSAGLYGPLGKAIGVVPSMAGLGALNEGVDNSGNISVADALKGGAKGALFGAVLHGAGKIPASVKGVPVRPWASPAAGALAGGGATYAMGGSPQEVGVNAALGGLLANTAPDATPEVKYKESLRRGVDQGIKPSNKGRVTAKDRADYYGHVENGVKDIIGNKDNITLSDAKGDALPPGELPKTAGQMAEAVYQTKPLLWSEADARVKAADGVGIQIPTAPVVTELKSFAKAINRLPVAGVSDAATAEHALVLADVLEKHGSYTGADAVDEVTRLNNKVKGPMPSPNDVGKLLVDQIVAKHLRGGLDEAVTKATGEGTADLRARYGSLKAIEKDVTHRAGINARQSPVGIPGYINALGNAETLYGTVRLMSGDPSPLIKGLSMKWMARQTSKIRNPDRYIAKMFEDAAEYHKSQQAPAEAPQAPAPDTSGPLPPRGVLPAPDWTPTKYEYPVNDRPGPQGNPSDGIPVLTKGEDGVYRSNIADAVKAGKPDRLLLPGGQGSNLISDAVGKKAAPPAPDVNASGKPPFTDAELEDEILATHADGSMDDARELADRITPSQESKFHHAFNSMFDAVQEREALAEEERLYSEGQDAQLEDQKAQTRAAAKEMGQTEHMLPHDIFRAVNKIGVKIDPSHPYYGEIRDLRESGLKTNKNGLTLSEWVKKLAPGNSDEHNGPSTKDEDWLIEQLTKGAAWRAKNLSTYNMSKATAKPKPSAFDKPLASPAQLNKERMEAEMTAKVSKEGGGSERDQKGGLFERKNGNLFGIGAAIGGSALSQIIPQSKKKSRLTK